MPHRRRYRSWTRETMARARRSSSSRPSRESLLAPRRMHASTSSCPGRRRITTRARRTRIACARMRIPSVILGANFPSTAITSGPFVRPSMRRPRSSCRPWYVRAVSPMWTARHALRPVLPVGAPMARLVPATTTPVRRSYTRGPRAGSRSAPVGCSSRSSRGAMLRKKLESSGRQADHGAAFVSAAFDESALGRFLPDRKARARRAPGFHEVGVRLGTGSDGFQKVEDQRVKRIRHGRWRGVDRNRSAGSGTMFAVAIWIYNRQPGAWPSMRHLGTVLLLSLLSACGHTSTAEEAARSRAARATAAAITEIDGFCDQLASIANDPSRRRSFAALSAHGDAVPWQEYESA